MNKGYFITFEGLDGSGKTTQAQRLVTYLQERGHKTVLTREPGGTPLAEEIRRVVLTPTPESLVPMAEILLYAASRAQHVEHFIKPSLASGTIVISDRFVDSSIAYQGYGLGYDPTVVRQVNTLAIDGLFPDLTFFIDVDTEQALRRTRRRNSDQSEVEDRIESREIFFHERVREGFLKLANSDPRFIRIPADDKSIDQIQTLVIGYIQERFNL